MHFREIPENIVKKATDWQRDGDVLCFGPHPSGVCLFACLPLPAVWPNLQEPENWTCTYTYMYIIRGIYNYISVVICVILFITSIWIR